MPRRAGGRMSSGEQKMLTVARTLMSNPWVAPLIVEQMAGMILALKSQGVSILLSEQNTHFAALVADRACVLEKGEVRFRGTMAELAVSAEVRRAFLDL